MPLLFFYSVFALVRQCRNETLANLPDNNSIILLLGNLPPNLAESDVTKC